MGEFAEVTQRVDTIYKDMYIGGGMGCPSLMTRTTLLEDQMEKLNKNLSKMIWLLVAILLTGVGELVLKGGR